MNEVILSIIDEITSKKHQTFKVNVDFQICSSSHVLKDFISGLYMIGKIIVSSDLKCSPTEPEFKILNSVIQKKQIITNK